MNWHVVGERRGIQLGARIQAWVSDEARTHAEVSVVRVSEGHLRRGVRGVRHRQIVAERRRLLLRHHFVLLPYDFRVLLLVGGLSAVPLAVEELVAFPRLEVAHYIILESTLQVLAPVHLVR